MKKILAMVLAMMLVLSMSVAFADVASESTASANVEKTFYFTKQYKTTEGVDAVVYPAETLGFTVEADENNPTSDPGIEIADTTIDGNPDEIGITVKGYTDAGSYIYTITEIDPNADANDDYEPVQGVTYQQDSFQIQVLVSWNTDHTALERQIVFYSLDSSTAATDDKIDYFTNIYDYGTLHVGKEVTGNLGDQTKEFEITVTFDAALAVKSNVTYKVYKDGAYQDAVTIAADDVGGWTKTFNLAHGEYVDFSNIPAGVTYTVKEADKHIVADRANPTAAELGTLEGYTETYKITSGEAADKATNDGEKATRKVTGSMAEKTEDADSVKIINNKATNVETGISLDNAPYMILMGLVVLAGAAMIVKRASANR